MTPSERYELGETIAEGGQGVVRLARDRVLNRDVAVKTLKPAFRIDSPAARRFQDVHHR